MRRRLSILALSLLLTRAAYAVEDEPAPGCRSWYGWQSLLGDSVSVALVLAGGESRATTVGEIGYLAGGPVIHALHRHPREALASVALRGLLPFAGAALGSDAHCDALSCGVATGFVLGALTAMVIDDCILAWDDAPAPAPATAPALGITPLRGGGALSLAGAF
jgi:hypothetical protein